MADELKKLAQRFNDEVLSQGKIEVIDELVSDDFVERAEVPPGMPTDKNGLKQYMQMFRDAFPDSKSETIAMVSEGDEVWIQSLTTGTHKGEFMGIPATGKKISIEGWDRVRIKDGKAVEHWGVFDNMAMMVQLGVVEPPG